MPNSARAITVRPTGGVDQEMEDFVVKFMNKYAEMWIYSAEMQGDARHLHFGVIPLMKVTPDNLAKTLYDQLKKQFGNVFEIRKRSLYNKTWYAVDPDFFVRNPHFEAKAEDWVAYLTKDSDGIKSDSWDWEVVESELKPNEPDDVRTNKKHWYLKSTMQMFKDFKMPTDTYQQIIDSLNHLCFTENVTKYPDTNREHSYIADIWCAANPGKKNRDVVMRELELIRQEEKEIDRAMLKNKKRMIARKVREDHSGKRIRSTMLESLSSFKM